MIEDFLAGNTEKLKTELITNGLPEDLRTHLWSEVSLARCHHPTSIRLWHEACVKILLPYIYNDIEHNVLFIDRFAQACAAQQAKTLIAPCFDYVLHNHSLQDLLEYAVQFNDLSALQNLERTSIDLSSALIGCSRYSNLDMVQYLLPKSDPLYYYSYAWFYAIENNHPDIVEILQPHSHIVEAARHIMHNISERQNKTRINNYLTLICNTNVFGASLPSDVILARNCIQNGDLSTISLQSFPQSILEACCVLAAVCKNPTAWAIIDALAIIPARLAQYLQNTAYHFFKYAVSHHKISTMDLNFLLEHSVYENKERDILFLLRSGMDHQPTIDKWASYNPECINHLLKCQELVDAEQQRKQRKMLLASTLGVHANKERKI